MARDAILRRAKRRAKPDPLAERIDWVTLEREFIHNNDYPSVWTWLRTAKGWPQNKIEAGNTWEHTAGWGEKRASFQREYSAKLRDEALQIAKERMPFLLRAKLDLIAQIIGDVKQWSTLSAIDKKLCYEILKIELGESLKAGEQKPEVDMDKVIDMLERKTDYGKLGEEALRQMVAAEQPVQDPGQAGEHPDVPAERPAA